MKWFEWILFASAIVFAGNVLGCMILCDTIPQIKSAKKYAWLIPIMNVALFFSFLFEAFGRQAFQRFWRFIILPHKNILTLHAMVQILEEERVEERSNHRFPRKELPQKQHAVFREIFAAAAKLI